MAGISATGSIGSGFSVLKTNVPAAWPYAAFFVVIGVLVVYMSAILMAAPTGTLPSAGVLYKAFGTLGIILALSILVSPLLNGMYISGAGRLGSKGGRIGLAAAFEVAKRRYPSILGATILKMVIELVVGAVIVGIALVVGLASSALGLLVAVILFIAAAVYLVPRLFFPEVLVVLGGKTAVEAVRANFAIGREAFWGIWGVALLLFLITVAVSIVLTVLVAAAYLAGGSWPSLLVHGVGEVVVGVFIGLLIVFTQVAAYRAYMGRAPTARKAGAKRP